MNFVCLGNTGDKYKNTRHNAGRMFGNFIAKKLKVQNEKLKKGGRILELENGWQVVFLDCLMNNSGPCLKKLLNFTNYKSLSPSHLYVVHDDLDIPFGEFKVQSNRGAAGHKGVQSIIDALGTKDFGRVRIGIGRPPENIPPENYVLVHFVEEEKKKLEKVFEEVIEKLRN